MKTCGKHMGGGVYDTELCGKPANWVTPDGKAVCGIHRKVADRYHRRTRSGLQCTPIDDQPKEPRMTKPKTPRKRPGPPSRGGKTPLISFRLSPDLVARLDQRARIEGTDRTAVLRSACEKYLAIPAVNGQSGKNTRIV